MRSEAEVDAIMVAVPLDCRRLCGWLESGCGCACMGCVSLRMTRPEFEAWELRELSRPPTPWIDPNPWVEPPAPLTLHERLVEFKRRKHGS
jgi:hypothetical protein